MPKSDRLLEDVLAAWCRLTQRPEQALAGAGKQINGANRHGHEHCETVTLIEYESHLPIAVLGFCDQGGELAAMADLFKRTDIAGRTPEESREAGGAGSGEVAEKTPETVYLITSLAPKAASAERLLGLCRGHWAVESMSHRQREFVCGEDACLMRTGNGPTSRAVINNLALAALFRSRNPAADRTLADTRTRLQMQRDQAIRALTSPWAGPPPNRIPRKPRPAVGATRPVTAGRVRTAGGRRETLRDKPLIRTFGAGSAPPKPISSNRGLKGSICLDRMGKS